MSEPPPPQRIGVIWSPEARADLRAVQRETAMRILHCVDRYLANRAGDVKKLKPPFSGFRLRCGDYRIFFDLKDENTINVAAVLNRREAYR
ncbi:MAG TPA: type II toxin-antitoxin system RelE/ParE family toxin [Terriglobia bacterium]|nr:type II toxin-antitoxin system RelE/ParE family toxin [Terriglobia bacterium]